MLGSGGGQVEVCRINSDCIGGATDIPVVTMDNDVDGVGRACVAPLTMPGCALGGQRTVLGFGSALDPGADGVCDTSPATDTTICADRPSDGFTMTGEEVIVFIYNGSLAATGFTFGAGAFGIDTDGVNDPPCPADPTNGSVVEAIAQVQSAPPLLGCCVCEQCVVPPIPTCQEPVTAPSCEDFCFQLEFLCSSLRFSVSSNCASGCGITHSPTPTSTATPTSTPTPTPSSTPKTGCPATPDPGCSAPAKALLKIKDKDANGAGAKDALLFKYIKGPAQAQADFGDPTSSADYSLCIYEGASSTLAVEANVAADGACDGKDCWKEIKSKGYKFKDKAAARDGISKILLKGDDAAPKTTVLVKGKDGALPLSADTLPLDTAGAITAQVHNSANSNCWGAVFPSAPKNEEALFKAKIP